MFERFSERARRVIFFARCEAGQLGSLTIDTEHLLLGLIRENETLVARFLTFKLVKSLREQIESRTPSRPKLSTQEVMPLTDESKLVLGYVVEEAERSGGRCGGTQHILLALLREEKSLAAQLLAERGLTLAQARAEFASNPPPAEDLITDD